MRLAAAYVRVSTDDQVEFSPDSQIKQIRDYAKRNDMLLLDDYIFMDEGISGKDTKHRESFNRMIGLAKTKPTPFEYILVWKFSRFARNREDSVVYKSMLRKQCGIQVISISEALGDDKTSVLIEAMIEAMDEYYSINLAEEVRRGMTEKATRGGIVSVAPYGYKIQDGIYVPDEHADFVRSIFADFIAGEGCRTIAYKYSNLGVRTTRGNVPDNRFIEYILRNPVYIGKIRWCAGGRGASARNYDHPNNIISVGKHEPLISQETFAAAQQRLEEIKSMYGKYQRRDSAVKYMLKGLVRCDSCGATLVMTTTKCPSLQCHNYARGSCTVSHSISIAKANAIIIEALKSAVQFKQFNIVPKTPSQDQSLTDSERLLQKERAKLNRAKLAYTEGVDTLEEYKRTKAEIQKRIDDLSQKVKPQKAFDPNKYAKTVSDVLKIITGGSSEETKNSSLRTIIDHIDFNKSQGALELYYKA